MTRRSFLVESSLLALLCLLSAGPTTASAQVACPQPISGGVIPVDQNHIFCGDVRVVPGVGPVAGGFHSRPGGNNPVSVNPTPATAIVIPPLAPAGIYRLTNFNITSPPPPAVGNTALKALSTMFPDACTQANVVAAIQNAAQNGAWVGPNFIGPSGLTCQAGVPPAPFNILVVFNVAGQVRTAYPNY